MGMSAGRVATGRGDAATRAVAQQRRCPLHDVRWLRLVVDEGHVLGGEDDDWTAGTVDEADGSQLRKACRDAKKAHKESPGVVAFKEAYKEAKTALAQHQQRQQKQEERTRAAAFLDAVGAERRWVMTGTPTTGLGGCFPSVWRVV